MAYENIRIAHPNFCIGPQTGTFCSIDTSGASAVLRVKNSSGDLIRSYDFYPNNILDVDSESGTYPYHKLKNIRYIGPRDQAGFYTGMVFYTLERIVENASNYSESCIIRRWYLNTSNSRLELYQTFTKTSSGSDWFDCNTFVIEHINTVFKNSTAANTGFITLTTASGLEKYDIMILGPSNDATNPDVIEYVYVHNVSGDDVEIRTLSAGTPTQYEYLEDDPVTIIKYAYLFSNSDSTHESAIYKLDPDDYFSVVDKHENGLYNNVIASGWNTYLSSISFVKYFNIISIQTSDYEVISSHVLKNSEANKYDWHTIYDLDYKGTSIYRLQNRVAKWDDYGAISVSPWTTYNYIEDTVLPYSASASLKVSTSAIIVRQNTVDLTVTVRDQYGVTLSNKNIQFYHNGDSGAYFTPSNGQATTNINGQATITYTSGAVYDSTITFSVRSDGSSTHTGSQYVWDFVYGTAEANYSTYSKIIKQILSYTASCKFKQLRLAIFSSHVDGSVSIGLPSYSKFSFPGGHWTNTGAPFNTKPTRVIEQAFLPYLNELNAQATAVIPSNIQLGQYDILGKIETDNNPEANLIQIDRHSDDLQLSQTYISRHYTYGHEDNTTVNQFVFVQEARPEFWSVKNAVNTDIWLRLRPFAASLDPSTFKIWIKEYSYAGKEDWREITSEGTITLFDAGGGFDGIEFQWYPSEFFHTNGIVYVNLEIYDEAPTPNRIYIDYWFNIIPDYKAPYLENVDPDREDYDVAVDTNISFDVLDLNTGVDIDSLEMFVNYKRVYPITTILSGSLGYHVEYNPTTYFNYDQTVSVSVRVQDSSDNDNLLIDSWRFYCISSTAPWFDSDNVAPGRCKRGINRKYKDIDMQVYGYGNGVNVDSIEVYIGGPRREIIISPIVYRLS